MVNAFGSLSVGHTKSRFHWLVLVNGFGLKKECMTKTRSEQPKARFRGFGQRKSFWSTVLIIHTTLVSLNTPFVSQAANSAGAPIATVYRQTLPCMRLSPNGFTGDHSQLAALAAILIQQQQQRHQGLRHLPLPPHQLSRGSSSNMCFSLLLIFICQDAACNFRYPNTTCMGPATLGFDGSRKTP